MNPIANKFVKNEWFGGSFDQPELIKDRVPMTQFSRSMSQIVDVSQIRDTQKDCDNILGHINGFVRI